MKTVTVTVDGRALVLGPLLAATIRDNRELIKQSRLGTIAPEDMVDLTCTLVHAAATRVDPGVTFDEVTQLVDFENMGTLFQACWGVSAPEPAQGEAQAAPSQST